MNTLWLASYFSAGAMLGLLYFGGLWWNTQMLEKPGSVRAAIALMAARFTVLGAALALAGWHGARPLLATALGILVARAVVMRHVGSVT